MLLNNQSGGGRLLSSSSSSSSSLGALVGGSFMLKMWTVDRGCLVGKLR
jgi:hypothetical protein